MIYNNINGIIKESSSLYNNNVGGGQIVNIDSKFENENGIVRQVYEGISYPIELRISNNTSHDGGRQTLNDFIIETNSYQPWGDFYIGQNTNTPFKFTNNVYKKFETKYKYLSFYWQAWKFVSGSYTDRLYINDVEVDSNIGSIPGDHNFTYKLIKIDNINNFNIRIYSSRTGKYGGRVYGFILSN